MRTLIPNGKSPNSIASIFIVGLRLRFQVCSSRQIMMAAILPLLLLSFVIVTSTGYAIDETMLVKMFYNNLKKPLSDSPIVIAQYVPCYKQDSSMNMVLFRKCPNGKPWTPTNDLRNFCYVSSEECARAEMPQSWCIKCGENDG